MFRDDGITGSATTEVNTSTDTNVRDKPTLRSLLITEFPADGLGKTFTFQVQVFNVVGSTLSNTATYVLAGIPSTPVVGPSDDTSVTSST